MKLIKIAAIPDDLFVGKNATIMKAHANRFTENNIKKIKNNSAFTFVNTAFYPTVAMMVTRMEVTIEITI